MNKLNIKFEYCYGIKRLEKELVFSNRTFAIYAPNGSMKTSFAKTFKDLMKGEETKDLILTSDYPPKNAKNIQNTLCLSHSVFQNGCPTYTVDNVYQTKEKQKRNDQCAYC